MWVGVGVIGHLQIFSAVHQFTSIKVKPMLTSVENKKLHVFATLKQNLSNINFQVLFI